MSIHGSFSGNPKTEWLVDSTEPDRDMSLISDFTFTDPPDNRGALRRALW